MPFNTQRTSPSPTSRLGGGGLDYITSSTFSAAATVSIDGCFTSGYQNYLLMIEGQASASPTQIRMRMRLSASDNSTANYSVRRQYNGAGTNLTNETSAYICEWYPVDSQAMAVDVINPALAKITGIMSKGMVFVSATNPQDWNMWGLHNVATAFDGFSLFPNTGTMTGTVTVFGYRKA